MADAFHKSLWRPGKTRDGRPCQSVGESLADIAASLAALAELQTEDPTLALSTRRPRARTAFTTLATARWALSRPTASGRAGERPGASGGVSGIEATGCRSMLDHHVGRPTIAFVSKFRNPKPARAADLRHNPHTKSASRRFRMYYVAMFNLIGKTLWVALNVVCIAVNPFMVFVCLQNLGAFDD